MSDTAPAATGPAVELQRLQALLALREEALATAQAELDDFLRVVSHDLRAPLRHVGAFGQLLGERLQELGDDAEASEYLQTMLRSGQHLGAMVDGLLMLAQIARAPLDRQRLDMGALANEAWERCRDAQAAPRAVAWRIAPGVPACDGDAGLVRQLLQHALSNALKFTRACPVAAVSFEGMTRADGGTEYVVRDNGVGFDPTRAGRLFGVFERLHSTTEFEGLGVGLAAARRIVRRHGGDIRVDAVAGSGCRVRFSLDGPLPDAETPSAARY